MIVSFVKNTWILLLLEMGRAPHYDDVIRQCFLHTFSEYYKEDHAEADRNLLVIVALLTLFIAFSMLSIISTTLCIYQLSFLYASYVCSQSSVGCTHARNCIYIPYKD